MSLNGMEEPFAELSNTGNEWSIFHSREKELYISTVV